MPYSKTRALLVVAAVFLLSALLTACGPQAPAPLATRTPLPTFTPPPSVDQEPIQPDVPPVAEEPAPQEPAPQEPAAPEAPGDQASDETQGADTQDPTPLEPAPAEPEPELPTPEPDPQVTVSSMMNVRAGPGTNYNIIGSANAGQTFRVTGRNPENTWWQIDFNGQPGWLFGDLVTAQNTQAVAVASNIPAPPPPTATPIPQPTPVPQPPAPETEPPAPEPEPQEPEPQEPEPQEPEPPSQGDFPFTLGEGRCDPNAGMTYFEGYVRDSNNNPVNGVCVHIHFYEPRNTKCSGCDGVGDGVWGFSPFGGPAPQGTPVEIFVVACDPNIPESGQTAQSGFGDLTPQSPKWTRVINESEQCTGITFYQR
jgi:uncharacterized protein YraI